MKISDLWIGVGSHAPNLGLAFGYRKGVMAHHQSWFNYAHYLRWAQGFTLKTLDRPQDLPEYEGCERIVLTYNPYDLREEQEEYLAALVDRHRGAKIINAPERLELIRWKDRFFDRFGGMGMPVPEFRRIESLDDLEPLGFPFILKAADCRGGDRTELIENEEQAAGALRRRPAGQRLIGVEYLDPFNEEFGYHVAYRVHLVQGKLSFHYPNIARGQWNLHCGSVKGNRDRKTYLEVVARSSELTREHEAMFRRVAEELSLDFVAIDFLESNGRVYLIEAELKYGPTAAFFTANCKAFGLSREDLGRFYLGPIERGTGRMDYYRSFTDFLF